MINVDAFLLNIDEYNEETINGFMNTYLGILSEKLGAQLGFKFSKTNTGYTYTIDRYCYYKLGGNHVIDVDCALITGFKKDDFRINPMDSNHRPKTFCVCWYDGFYTPSNELARLYKKIVGAGDEFAIPKKVKISAYSTHIDVTVDYNPEDIPKDAPIAKE